MFKKLYLSAAFATLSLTASVETTDRIATIQQSLAHIAQETKAIMLEVQMALTLGTRAEKHFQEILQDIYQSTKEQCLALLSTITASAEFTSTIDQVTDTQLALIVEENAQFDDIIIDSAAFPLEQKIKDELAAAAFDGHTQQLFNVFYVVYAVIHGSKTLLEKLELKKNELTVELEALQAADQTTSI